jgi:hypothetical protein
MTISPDLFLAILSMDAYNRGFAAGIKDGNNNDPDGLGDATGTQIGNATIRQASNSNDNSKRRVGGSARFPRGFTHHQSRQPLTNPESETLNH